MFIVQTVMEEPLGKTILATIGPQSFEGNVATASKIEISGRRPNI